MPVTLASLGYPGFLSPIPGFRGWSRARFLPPAGVPGPVLGFLAGLPGPESGVKDGLEKPAEAQNRHFSSLCAKAALWRFWSFWACLVLPGPYPALLYTTLVHPSCTAHRPHRAVGTGS